MQVQHGSTPTWSVAVPWVHWPWGSLGGAGQCQPHLCFAQSHPAWAIKQSEKAANCAGLGASQAKPSSETNLAAAVPSLELTEAS